jgi:hypothetical protein
VFAARVQDRQNHQVRIRKEPLLSFRFCGLGYPGDRAKVPVSSETSKMIKANACQVSDFIFREEFLTRLNSDHLRSSPAQMLNAQ